MSRAFTAQYSPQLPSRFVHYSAGICLTGLSLAAPLAISADKDTEPETLADIVVTSTKIAVPAQYSTQSVTIITEEQIREAVEYTKNQRKILCYPSKILEALKDRVVSDESYAVLRMFQSRIGNVYEGGNEELVRLEKRDGALFASVRVGNGEVRSRRVQDPRRLWRDIEEGRLKELSPDAWP